MIQDYIQHRESSYNISNELKFARVIESNLDDNLRLKKNDDEFGVDFEVWRTTVNGDEYKDILVGYIELEEKPKWLDKWPENYKEYSFLRRKIDVYHKYTNEFTNTIVKDGHRTVYVCFNRLYNDCICNTVQNIKTNLTPKVRNLKDLDTYKDSYYTCPVTDIRLLPSLFKDDPIIHIGYNNSINFINEFFINI